MDAERVMVGKKPKVLYEYTVLRDSGFGKTCLFCVRGLDFLNTPVVPAQAATPFPSRPPWSDFAIPAVYCQKMK
jgi:hypothetical protein